MSTWSLTYRQSVFESAEWQTFIRVLPTRWRRKPAGIDTERNCVSVILCIQILLLTYLLTSCCLPCRVSEYGRQQRTGQLCTVGPGRCAPLDTGKYPAVRRESAWRHAAGARRRGSPGEPPHDVTRHRRSAVHNYKLVFTCIFTVVCLQCFDTAGWWAPGRASGL